MDWGLISFHRDGRVTRRQRALYPFLFYFFAVIINCLLRFSWYINRLPGMNHIHSSIIVLIIEIGEVFRRSMWNIIRIEWEIINQQDKALVGKELVDK
jgi:cellulose synthase/poly-beta-1,6-N-acetylglucosamine synthase-like glycosyltransferase